MKYLPDQTAIKVKTTDEIKFRMAEIRQNQRLGEDFSLVIRAMAEELERRQES